MPPYRSFSKYYVLTRNCNSYSRCFFNVPPTDVLLVLPTCSTRHTAHTRDAPEINYAGGASRARAMASRPRRGRHGGTFGADARSA